MPKVKLLQMINSAAWGGGEAHMLSLVRHFSHSDFAVYAAFPQDGPLVESVRRCGARALVLGWRGVAFSHAVMKLVGLLREERVHVVHSHDVRTNLLGRVAGKVAGIPAIVSTYHISVSDITDIGRFKKALYLAPDRLTFPLCHGAIAVSDAVRCRLMVNGYPDSSRITVIHNGVDLSRFTPGEQTPQTLPELGIPPGVPVVGTVARLSHEKSQGSLIRAMLKVKSGFPHARCLIVGAGPMDERLRKLAVELGLGGDCIFTGHRDDVPALLSVMDVFVLPSATEGFPTSLLEAMAMGRAVVAFEVGGVPEIMEHGKTGILVEPGKEHLMAEAIISLLNDGDARRRMGMAGRTRVEEHFDLKAAMEEIERLYLRLLRGKVVP